MREGLNCMVTGHREIPVHQQAYVEEWLRKEIAQAYQEGYTCFLSGFAFGCDLLFAKAVVDMRRTLPIRLEAVIPYRKRLKCKDALFVSLLQASDQIRICSENYDPACFMRRNKLMVDLSHLVLGVYDGRLQGGTWATLRYARTLGKPIRCLKL